MESFRQYKISVKEYKEALTAKQVIEYRLKNFPEEIITLKGAI